MAVTPQQALGDKPEELRRRADSLGVTPTFVWDMISGFDSPESPLSFFDKEAWQIGHDVAEEMGIL